jgi:YggT family protein
LLTYRASQSGIHGLLWLRDGFAQGRKNTDCCFAPILSMAGEASKEREHHDCCLGKVPAHWSYLPHRAQHMNLIIDILRILLDVVWWIIIVQAILSWLIAFNVINTQNPVVRQIWTTLDRMTQPIYAPIRRVLPDFGGLDLSPLVVLVALAIINRVLTEIQFSFYVM